MCEQSFTLECNFDVVVITKFVLTICKLYRLTANIGVLYVTE